MSEGLERRLVFIDKETGEIKSNILLPKKTLGEGWTALYQLPAIWLAKIKLTKDEYRVLLYLLGIMDFQNYIRVTQKDIAEELEIHKQNVYKAIKGLVQHNIITPESRLGHSSVYRLNPDISHKGLDLKDTKSYYKELHEFYEEGKS